LAVYNTRRKGGNEGGVKAGGRGVLSITCDCESSVVETGDASRDPYGGVGTNGDDADVAGAGAVAGGGETEVCSTEREAEGLNDRTRFLIMDADVELVDDADVSFLCGGEDVGDFVDSTMVGVADGSWCCWC
jgi:hypothetical protein